MNTVRIKVKIATVHGNDFYDSLSHSKMIIAFSFLYILTKLM